MKTELIPEENKIQIIYCPSCNSIEKFELHKIDDNAKIFQCCDCESQYKVSKEPTDIDYKQL